MILALLLACTGEKSAGDGAYTGDAWADNWFALYADEALVVEDSVPITTERSFNAETFSFDLETPAQLALVLKDYKEDDTGLEYIGEDNQQMGDGGFILQISDSSTGDLLVVSDDAWRCLVIHTAPLDPTCADDANPEETCTSEILDEPEGWKTADYDDSAWTNASEYTEADVSPKEGYDDVRWDPSAALIWGDSLTQDNTLLSRRSVG